MPRPRTAECYEPVVIGRDHHGFVHADGEGVPVEPAGTPSREPLSAELLGFPAGARVLIVNCDDLGMHPA